MKEFLTDINKFLSFADKGKIFWLFSQ